ncbi:hypothetical protein FZEAL_2075 [Fusarium zealandicum]|uniref:Apple domain-containing protein n=1 Tax=Fusarium zealandicum TaxID=1053134 RepID=A0A8H4XPA9_9HYPO|nr:hypothetical protein FZEAL_2075 [Fusarium zealandicum]
MCSILAGMALAFASGFTLVSAGPCKPNHSSVTSTVTELIQTPDTRVIKNEVANGGFAIRDVQGNVPGCEVEGEAEIVTGKGYQGDGSSTNFYQTWIVSIVTSIQWDVVLKQVSTDARSTPLRITMNCLAGGASMIYVDSIFMSNQVTPQNIDDFQLDFGDEQEKSMATPDHTDATDLEQTASTTSELTFASSQTNSRDISMTGMETQVAGHTDTRTTLQLSSASTQVLVTSSAETLPEETETLTTAHEPAYTSNSALSLDVPTESTSTTSTATDSTFPTGAKVCPRGIDPPAYCQRRKALPTQTVSLPGIMDHWPQKDGGVEPAAPMVCNAFGDKKNGWRGRGRENYPKQNTIEECAQLCRVQNDCEAFGLIDYDTKFEGGKTCALSTYKLATEGIDIEGDVPLETETWEPPLPPSSPAEPSCPVCEYKSPLPANRVCGKLGIPTLDAGYLPKTEYRLQGNHRECALICSKLDWCRASAYVTTRKHCIFGYSEISPDWFHETQVEDDNELSHHWSSKDCWTCNESRLKVPLGFINRRRIWQLLEEMDPKEMESEALRDPGSVLYGPGLEEFRSYSDMDCWTADEDGGWWGACSANEADWGTDLSPVSEFPNQEW